MTFAESVRDERHRRDILAQFRHVPLCMFLFMLKGQCPAVSVPSSGDWATHRQSWLYRDFLTRLLVESGSLPFGNVWDNTNVLLPDSVEGTQYRNIFTDEIVGAWLLQEEKEGLALFRVFANFPVALLAKEV